MNKNDADVVIAVDDVYKDFFLPHDKGHNSLKGVIVNAFKKRDKSIDTQHALRGISFNIKKGEFFGIVGRNGSGKSTLLKVLAGIYQPTNGSVRTKGKLVPFIELGVGFNPELTGRENVYLNGALLGFSRKEIDSFYDEIVDFAELHDFMEQKLKNYSSGMQVRLAFSVATHAKADILLIDEVLAVGDADFQRKCYEYFRRLKREKTTIVFVSHDMNAVREYCDRAILIEKAEIKFSGTADKISDEYAKLFLPANSEKNEDSKNDIQQSKWGLGGAEMISVSTTKRLYETDANLDFAVKIRVDQDFPDGLNFGFAIKNELGVQVFGQSTRTLRVNRVKPRKRGEIITVKWSTPNIFSEGKYFYVLAVSRPDGAHCQLWEAAASFRVYNKFNTGYPVTPKVSVEITNEP